MHPLLSRQIKRFTNQDISDSRAVLFEAISAYYREIDIERALLENALRVNSEELTAINDKLHASTAQELANQRALLHEIIDSIPDLIFIKNTESVYQGCNKAFELFFGATEKEIIGKTDFDFVEVALATFFRQKDQEMLEQGCPCANEEWVSYPNGKMVCLETVKTPYSNPDGVLLGLIGISRDITERKRSEAALLENERRFRNVLEFAPIGMGLLTLDGRFTNVNQALCDLLGYTKVELESLSNQEITHPVDYPACAAQYRQLLNGEMQGIQSELRLLHKRGGVVWVNLSVVMQRDTVDAPGYFIGQVEDISAQHEVHEKDHFMASVLDNVFDGVVTIDEHNVIDSFNKAAERIFGYVAEEIIGKDVGMLMPQPYQQQHANYVHHYHATGQMKIIGVEREVVGKRKDGSIFPLEIAVSEIKDGGTSRFIGIVRDVTERKSAEEKMRHLAHYDVLTDLPNRILFDDRLLQALAIAKRDGLHVALMLVDLDKFKPVNDTFGHQIGDLLLKEVAVRLRECLRDSDTAARIGGDEFVVLLPSVESIEDATVVAEKILRSLCQPFGLAGQQLYISASIGVAVNPEPDCAEKRLIRMADIAMYQAKARGSNRVVCFQEEMDSAQNWAI